MNIKPLDEPNCRKLGHVAFILEDEAQPALRAMFNALAQTPCNAALWAQPSAALDADTRKNLRAWRDSHDFSKHDKMPHNPITLDEEHKRISYLFNDVSRGLPPAQKQALAVLQAHIHKRIDDLKAAWPDIRHITVQIRATGTRQGKGHRSHIDGHSFAGNHKVRTIRILEPIDSDGTLVYDNNDYEIKTAGKAKQVRGYGWLKSWDVVSVQRPAEDKPAYSAPANGLLAITNDIHPWKAVLHNEPPAIEGRPEALRRLLVCYDIALPRDCHRKA